MTWFLVEYEGRVGVTLGWSTAQQGPFEERPIWVHPTAKWDEHYYGQWDQGRMAPGGGNVLWFTSNRSYNTWPMDINGWEMVTEKRPIPAPGRGGKDWYWKWSDFSKKWMKEWK